MNVIARSYRDARVLEINPFDSKDLFPNLGCNVQVSTFDSSRLEISVGKAETPLQQELSIDKAEIRLQLSQENIDKNLGDTFCSIILGMKQSSQVDNNSESTEPRNLSFGNELVSLDTTALIALLSGISNDGTERNFLPLRKVN